MISQERSDENQKPAVNRVSARSVSALKTLITLSFAVIAILLTLFAGAKTASAQGEVGTCVEARGGNSCTAGDTRIQSLVKVDQGEGCVNGLIEVTFRAEVKGTAQTRYDVGFFISTSGGSAFNGPSCWAEPLQPVHTKGDDGYTTDGSYPGYYNADGDSCGDITNSEVNSKIIGPILVACVEDPNNPGRLAPISTCSVYDQNAGAVCLRGNDLKPGTGSKCYCGPSIALDPPVVIRQIIVEKVTDPNPDSSNTDFGFTFTSPAPGDPEIFTLKNQETWSSGAIPAGTYSVDETAIPEGWDMTEVICTDQNDLTYEPGEIVLQANQNTTVTCTFTNTKRGTITAHKFYDLDGDNILDAGEPPVSDWSMALFEGSGCSGTELETGTTGLDGNVNFDLLLPGSYSVRETPGSNWINSTMPCQNVALGPGETAIRNFGNYQTDWGDAPESYQCEQGGPRHVLYPNGSGNATATPNTVGDSPAIWLGTKVDREIYHQGNWSATGDDLAISDDEDGVTLLDTNNWCAGACTQGWGGKIRVNFSSSMPITSNFGYLVVWFDVDRSGTFEADEAFVNASVLAPNWIAGYADYAFLIPAGTDLTDTNLYYRARLFEITPASPASAFCGLYTNGEVEDYMAPAGTLPVSLSYFSAVQRGNTVHFEWTTSIEAGNAGFNLYVETEAGRQKVNDRLIRSQAMYSLEPLDYTFAAKVAGEVFFIEEVSIQQQTYSFGPFKLGEPAGVRFQAEAIPWAAIGAEHRSKEAARAVREAAQVSRELQERGRGKPVSSAGETNAAVVTGAVPLQSSSASGAAVPDRKPPQPTATPTTPPPTATPTTPPPTGTPTEPPPTATPTEPPPTATPTATPTTPPPTATPTPTPLPAVRVGDLLVNRTGIHRVSFEALQTAGLDVSDQPAADLALLNRGNPLPIRVVSGPNFGPGSYIEFYGEALDTIYTDTNVYTLWLDPASAQRVAVDSSPPDAGAQPAVFYMDTKLVHKQNIYDFGAPGSDPWYDSNLNASPGRPASRTYAIDLDGYVAGAAPSTLDLGLYGGVDFPASPDHHLVVTFNGELVADARFDGVTEYPISAVLPLDLARAGNNSLTLTLPGSDLPDGVSYDFVALDRYSLTYPRSFVARSDGLSFTAAGAVFQVSGFTNDSIVAYRLAGTTPTFLAGAEASGGTVALPGADVQAAYIVSTEAALLTPAAIKPAVTPADITAGPAQYLVISHPDFIAGLDLLVQARQAQGLSVKVVDVRDVYALYSGGIFDAQAIRDYLVDAAPAMGTQYVLLVGGDSYDYRNFRGTGVISFMPSLYTQLDEIVHWAPVDPLFADLNGDDLPDLAIGRLPVRTSAELANVIGKTLGYATKNYPQTAVFAADQTYSPTSNSLVATLSADWSVTNAYIDEVGPQSARTTLLASMNAGVALTNYVGHSGAREWTTQGLFNTTDAAALTNYNRPTVVVQWGCWNTYYASPSLNTLGHKLMLSGTNGAAAVLGAVALSLESSELALGAYLTPLMTQPGMPLGVAITQAKAQVAAASPSARDVLLGWTLLGDPALVIRP